MFNNTNNDNKDTNNYNNNNNSDYFIQPKVDFLIMSDNISDELISLQEYLFKSKNFYNCFENKDSFNIMVINENNENIKIDNNTHNVITSSKNLDIFNKFLLTKNNKCNPINNKLLIIHCLSDNLFLDNNKDFLLDYNFIVNNYNKNIGNNFNLIDLDNKTLEIYNKNNIKNQLLIIVISPFSNQWIEQNRQNGHFDRISIQGIHIDKYNSDDYCFCKTFLNNFVVINQLSDLKLTNIKNENAIKFQENLYKSFIINKFNEDLYDLKFNYIGEYFNIKVNYNNLECMFSFNNQTQNIMNEINTNDGNEEYTGEYNIFGRNGRGILTSKNDIIVKGCFKKNNLNGLCYIFDCSNNKYLKLQCNNGIILNNSIAIIEELNNKTCIFIKICINNDSLEINLDNISLTGSRMYYNENMDLIISKEMYNYKI